MESEGLEVRLGGVDLHYQLARWEAGEITLLPPGKHAVPPCLRYCGPTLCHPAHHSLGIKPWQWRDIRMSVEVLQGLHLGLN